ncbi:iron donor protein CyaY [Paramagnetospirillum marisnigri]|uniref:Iron donor protein CyaY n=1 Tax=Paramagnetospirillum marisnigri TaxID=1285242 RepID=A0A178MX31_9PROT|nr:iron donor protein CyaY [Paramagnetospirillum marisnigri]OAN54048.1 iron donor protein CyaY [Paramagnetospirillum marisnigri]
MSLDENAFATMADRFLERVADAVEDTHDDADADIQSGILTITLPGIGQYVINKHAPNREIWLSSPKSGAFHFAQRDGDWVSTRDASVSLVALLTRELGIAL